MKYLCIDYGARRVGVAVSDAEGGIAFPRAVLANTDALIGEIAAVVTRERVEKIIIGDTRAVGGGANPVTHEAEAFARDLGNVTAVPVEMMWEAWSSIEASRYAPEGKGHDDSSAAAVILQRYLDMRGNTVQ